MLPNMQHIINVLYFHMVLLNDNLHVHVIPGFLANRVNTVVLQQLELLTNHFQHMLNIVLAE